MKQLFCFLMLFVVGFSSICLATHGTNLIGASPASQGMGGTGVANYTNGIDALYLNPSLLASPAFEGPRLSADIYGSYYQGSASANGGAGAKTSQAGAKIVPGIGATYSFHEKWAVGLGVLTYAGGAFDYK
ncbi:MAG: hypothetical protein HY537_16720, partial [Deltaproteobacteria bacterium]|nr:hypothetical protein [Deltaproteobacteria bacterium]